MMTMLSLVLEPDADGNLTIPVPEELRHQRIRIDATLSALPTTPDPAVNTIENRGLGMFKGKIHLSSDFDEPLEEFQEYMY